MSIVALSGAEFKNQMRAGEPKMGLFVNSHSPTVAEQLAQIQISLEEIGLQSDIDFARPEFLWQMIGTLVFPETSKPPSGPPEISGDLSYREFLRRMILLLHFAV